MNRTEQIEMVREYCDFNDPSLVYILLCLPRKKDQDIEQTERDKLRKRQRFVVSNMDDVEFSLSEFERYASMYDELTFRVYISVNRRSLKKGLQEFQKRMLDISFELVNGNDNMWSPIKKLGSEFKSILAKKTCRYDKNFHYDIDLDNTSDSEIKKVMEFKDLVEEHTEILDFRPTVSGFSMVVKPFNHTLVEMIEGVEMKTDSYLYVAVIKCDGV